MNWNDIFEYHEGFLFWKTSTSPRVKIGAMAGNKTGPGYWQVCYNKKFYKLHRVIWEMFNPPIEALLEIDHIDRDKDNNKLENLRLASRTLNSHNRGVQSNSKTGVKGVSHDPYTNKFRAFIKDNGVTVNLGSFDTIEQASSVYQTRLSAVTKLH